MGGDGTSACVENSRIPVFSTEDPLYLSVKARLLADPDKKEVIRRLFLIDIRSAKAEIVGVRSEDILTFLDSFLNGSILVSRPGQTGIMGKEQGWFYLTPVYEDFMEAARGNAVLYSESSAFAAAFARNVMPVLKANWLSEARWILGRVYEPDASRYSDPLVTENIIDLFRLEVMKLKEERVSAEQGLGPQNKRRMALLQELFGLVRLGLDKVSVLKFLSEVAEKRGGVMVGFNEKVFQGKVESDRMKAPRAIHDINEMAIKPKNGRIDLSCSVVAIEPLGVYEDQVLREIGLD